MATVAARTAAGRTTGVESARDLEVIRRTVRYIHPYTGLMIWSLLLMMTAAAANLAGPYLVKVAIDVAIPRGSIRLLTLVALTYVLTSLIEWLCSFGQDYLISWVGQRVLFALRRDLFGHLQRLSFSFYDRTSTGQIMSRLTGDVQALNEFMTSALVTVASSVFVLVGIMVIMLSMNVPLALLTFTVVPGIVISTHLYRSHARQFYRRVRRHYSVMTGALAENISGVRAVQAYVREALNARRFAGINRQLFHANLKAVAFSAGYQPIMGFMSAIVIMMIIWYGGSKVLLNELSIGSLAAFLAYIMRFFQPITALSANYNALQQAMAGGERVYELLDTPVTVQDQPDAYELPPIQGHVTFDHVVFEYLPHRPVLRGISLEAKPGEMIALVGHTGAGKSSIINILLRFYDIRSGSITIDGHDIRRVTRASLRRQVGLVLQEPFLFSGPIQENLRYGKLDATQEELEAAARAVDLHDFITNLDFGYETVVHERGATLSQGQRQLLSFARALLADPRILILDEATSSVDTATEKMIQDALTVLLRGRTSLVIAHRLSTIQAADQIIVLRQGEIIERGTHEQLLAVGGHYAELYEMQFKYGAVPATAA